MRVAFPFPCHRSRAAGSLITLKPWWKRFKPLVDLEIIAGTAQTFDASKIDIAIYQVGNNAHHDFAYETALLSIRAWW